jgi:hypothetical protein
MSASRKSELCLSPKVWSALEYAICLSSCWISEGKVHIRILEHDVFDAYEMFQPVYEQRGRKAEKKLRGFDVEPEDCVELLEQFRNSPKVAKIIAENLAYNVLMGYPVPDGLRALSYQILSGEGKLPRPKAVKPTLTHRNTLLVGLAKRISTDAEIPLGSSEAVLSGGGAKPICGAIIAAAALHAFGVHINAPQASKIVYNKGNLVDDSYLFKRIFSLTSGSPVVNALAEITPAATLRSVGISKLQKEMESAINWLKAPI